MRIVCPSCSATFEVPKTRLAAGQAVRCARCGTEWTPLAVPEPALAAQSVGPAEQPLPARDPEPAAVFTPAPAVQAALPTRGPKLMLGRFNSIATADPALIAGWAVSIAALAGMIWAAVAWRSDVMSAWPPSERLYTALGLPADR